MEKLKNLNWKTQQQQHTKQMYVNVVRNGIEYIEHISV
jgi:hypothetical protein